MRWTPRCTGDIKEYDTFTFNWATSHERLYTTLLNAPLGTVSATAPANFNEALLFDVPEGADVFGVEFIGQRVTVGSDSSITWTTFKVEAFAAAQDQSLAASQTFQLDSGRAEEPIIWVLGSGDADGAVALSGRTAIDVSGGDAVFAAANQWLRAGALNTNIFRKSLIFSPFGSASGMLPYIGHYGKIALVFSVDPGVANVIARYTMKVRPFAYTIGTGGGTR